MERDAGGIPRKLSIVNRGLGMEVLSLLLECCCCCLTGEEKKTDT